MDQRSEPDGQRLRKFLTYLFPKLDTVFGRTSYEASYDQMWQRNLRVCSPEVFPFYFSMGIPEGEISNAEIQATLSIGADEQGLTSKLLELANQMRPDGITGIRPFLHRLENYTEDTMAVEQAKSLITVLLLIGDQLLISDDQPRGMFELDTDLSISRVIFQLMRRLKEEERFVAFRAAIERSTSLTTVAHEVSLLEAGLVQRSSSGDDHLLPGEHVEILKPESTEGGRRVSVLRRQEGAPVLLG